MTQNDMVLSHLQKGLTLTPMQALTRFRTSRLAARVNDLKRAGHDIQKVMIRTNTGARVAQYAMK